MQRSWHRGCHFHLRAFLHHSDTHSSVIPARASRKSKLTVSTQLMFVAHISNHSVDHRGISPDQQLLLQRYLKLSGMQPSLLPLKNLKQKGQQELSRWPLQAGSCEEFSGGRWTSIKQNHAWDLTLCDPNIQLKYFKWKKSIGLQSSVHCGLRRISSGRTKFIKQMLQNTAIWGRKENSVMKLLLSQIPSTVFIKVNRTCTHGSRSRHSPSTER